MVSLSVFFLVVTFSLVLQIVVLSLVLYGYWLYRKLNLKRHGVMMAGAVFVQAAAVFGIMIPSFVYAVFPNFILANPLELASVVSLMHEVTGGAAFALGVWFVASWRFRANFSGCFGKRKLMLATLIVWVAALVFGITLYSIFNWNILMG
jgi:hypothetical protein